MSYIGETGRTLQLQLRIKEHRRALTNGDPCMSALAEHAINNHHNIAWEDAIVVDADPHMYRRQTLEAWHIRQEPNPMNRDRGLLPQYMIPSSEPTHHQTLIYVDNVALSSPIVHCHCVFLFLPARELCSLPVAFTFYTSCTSLGSLCH